MIFHVNASLERAWKNLLSNGNIVSFCTFDQKASDIGRAMKQRVKAHRNSSL